MCTINCENCGGSAIKEPKSFGGVLENAICANCGKPFISKNKPKKLIELKGIFIEEWSKEYVLDN